MSGVHLMKRAILSCFVIPVLCASLSGCGGGDERIGKHVDLPDTGPQPVATTPQLDNMTIGNAEVYRDNTYNNIFTSPDSTTTLTATKKLHTELRRTNGLGPLVWTSPVTLGAGVTLSGQEVVLTMSSERMAYRLLNPTGYQSLQHVLWEYQDGSNQIGQSTAGYVPANWRTAAAGKTGTAVFKGEAYQTIVDNNASNSTNPHGGDRRVIYISNATAVFDYAKGTMTLAVGANPRLANASPGALTVDSARLVINADILMQAKDGNYGVNQNQPGYLSAEGLFYGPSANEFGGVIHSNYIDDAGQRHKLMTSFALRQARQ